MPLGSTPVCKNCLTEDTTIWRRENNDLICQTCYVKQELDKKEKTENGSNNNNSTKKNTAKPKSSRTKITRNKTSAKGKGRRSIFKNKFFSKRSQIPVSSSIVTNSLFHKGQYFQVGDIVSVIDNEDHLKYYAQSNGFFTDEFSQKYTSFTWLLPSKKLDIHRNFDPACFFLGPTDDSLHSMDAVEFVCHAPEDYYKPIKNMCRWIFLWVLVSSVIVHGVIALACFWCLHKHKQGRWYSLAIIAMGFIMPLTGGILSCVSIAGVYQSLGWSMAPRMALVWGGGQTVLVIWISFSRLLPTI